jgi:endo-1,4-beta-mannosidase
LAKPLFKTKENILPFLLGVNYWPADSAIHMWNWWNPKTVEKDIVQMKKLGMNCFRPFLMMPDFTDEKGAVVPLMVERLQHFLSLCDDHEISCMPSFIVGHMSGENWDVPWRQGKNFIRDPEVYKITENYICTLVRECQSHSSICAWLLSNELPNYAEETDPRAVAIWAQKIIGAIKKTDPHRPVSIGDGAWSPEILGEETAYHLRKLNRYQDFTGLHYYPRGMSPWHHTFTTAFRLAMAKAWGKPVIVEEFGTSTTLCSEENQAAYYRSVFYSALINDARGVLSWCLNDFDFTDERPYSHHPLEEHFGIIRKDTSLKPAAREFPAFAKVLSDLAPYQKISGQKPVGLFIPSNYYYRYPFQFQPEFKHWYDLYLETFSLLKRANLDVHMVVEPAQELENEGKYSHTLFLEPEEIPLLIIPRMKHMTKQTRQALDTYLQKGGALYFSFANDSWVPDWHTLAGIKTDCKFGVPDFYPQETLQVTFSKAWGVFHANDMINIPLKHTEPEFSVCPVLNHEGISIAEDALRSPFLLRHSVGNGTVWFSPFPLEMLALESQQDDWKYHLCNIYRSIYESVAPPTLFTLQGDGLEAGFWKKGSRYLIIIFNHDWKTVHGHLTVNFPQWKLDASSLPCQKEVPDKISFSLQRKGVCILKISEN